MKTVEPPSLATQAAVLQPNLQPAAALAAPAAPAMAQKNTTTSVLILAGGVAALSVAAAFVYYSFSSSSHHKSATARRSLHAPSGEPNRHIAAEAKSAAHIRAQLASVRGELRALQAQEALLDAEMQKLDVQRRTVRDKEMQLFGMRQALHEDISLHYANRKDAIVESTARQRMQLSATGGGEQGPGELGNTPQAGSRTTPETSPEDTADTAGGRWKQRRARPKPRHLSMQMSPSSKDMMAILRIAAQCQQIHFEAWARYTKKIKRSHEHLGTVEEDEDEEREEELT